MINPELKLGHEYLRPGEIHVARWIAHMQLSGYMDHEIDDLLTHTFPSPREKGQFSLVQIAQNTSEYPELNQQGMYYRADDLVRSSCRETQNQCEFTESLPRAV